MSRFKHNNFVTSYEEFGCEVNDGWLDICNEIIKNVEEYNRNRVIEDQIEISQIKSKFGELRVYLTDYNGNLVYPEGLYDFIRDCETRASNTCEYCGSHDNVTTTSYNGWIRTLCDKCNEKLRSEKKILK